MSGMGSSSVAAHPRATAMGRRIGLRVRGRLVDVGADLEEGGRARIEASTHSSVGRQRTDVGGAHSVACCRSRASASQRIGVCAVAWSLRRVAGAVPRASRHAWQRGPQTPTTAKYRASI